MCPRSACRDIGEPTPTERLGFIFASASRVAATRYLPPPLRERVPPLRNWRDSDVAQQVRRFERALRSTDKPALYVLHVVLPHRPWHYLPNGQQYGTSFDHGAGFAADPSDEENQVATTEDWPVTQQYQRHVLQAQYAEPSSDG